MNRSQSRRICKTSIAAFVAAASVMSSTANAQVTWNGTTDALWDTITNWSGGAEPLLTDDVIFPSTIPGTGGSITLTAGETTNSITFRNNYAFTGGSLEIASGSVNIEQGRTAIFNSQLTGTGGLIKTGNGSLRLLNNTNSFTGPMIINRGSVTALEAGALGAETSAIVVNGVDTTRGNGGGNITFGSFYGTTLSIARPITVSGGGYYGDNFALSTSGDVTLAAVANGAAVNARIGSMFGMMTITDFTAAAGRDAILTGAGNITISNAVAASTGRLIKTGGGTLVLSSNTNAFSGGLRADGGTIRITNIGQTGTGNLDFGGGTFEIRQDTAAFGKNVAMATNNGTFFLDRAVGGTGFDQILTFGNLALGVNRTLTFNTRNGYGATFTGASGTIGGGGAGNNTHTNNGAGLITYSANIWNNNDGTARVLTFNGNGDQLVTGNILAPNAIGHHVAKAGTGTLTVNGTASTYLGQTRIQNGILSLNDFRAINNASVSATAQVQLGATTTTGVLNLAGNNAVAANLTTAKIVDLAGTTGGGRINANQTGSSPAVVFTSALTATGAGAKTLTLGGANTLDNEIRGAIVDNSGANYTRLAKAEAGTWLLTGANTYTGLTQISGGVLKVADTFAGSSRNVVADASGLAFFSDAATLQAGGTLEYVGSASSASTESIGLLSIAGGAGTVRVTAGAGGTAALTIAGYNPTPVTTSAVTTAATTVTIASTAGLAPGMLMIGGTAGATIVSITNNTQFVVSANQTFAIGAPLSFVRPNGATVNFAPDSSSSVILGTTNAGYQGGHIHFGGTDFAFATGTSNTVLRAPLYDGSDAGFSTAAGVLTAAQHNLANANTSTGAVAINSLKITGNTTVTQTGALTINTGANTSGGIVASGGASTIAGGTNGVTTAGSGDLVIRVNGGSDTLALDTPILSTTTGGLTKTGTGVLVLSALNNQTGTTNINEGTVRLSGTGRLSAANQTLFTRQGATLDLNGVGTGTAIGQFQGSGTITNSNATAATLTVGNNNQGGLFTGSMQDGLGVLNVTKVGTASQTWSGVSSYTGVTTIGSTGAISIASLSNIGSPSGIGAGLVGNNAGSLVFNGTTGGLNYNGREAIATDRLFTFSGTGAGAGGALIANGVNNAEVVYNNPLPMAFSNTTAQTLTLRGASTGDNTVGIQIIDNPNAASLPTQINKTESGNWVLGNSANNFTGATTIVRGVLQAEGTTLPSTSPLVFNNVTAGESAVLTTSGTFTRNLAAAATAGTGTVTFLGTGGFAAGNSKLTVNLGGAGGTVTWGAGGFVPTGRDLVLNSNVSLFETEFVNPIDLNGATRSIRVDDNGNTNLDFAVVSGVVSGAAGLTKVGGGILLLNGANTYNGATNVNGGVLAVQTIDGSLGSSNLGVAGGAVNIGTGGTGATLRYVGTGETPNRTFNLAGTTGGATIDQSGSGPLVLTTFGNTTAGAKTLTLQGENADANELSAALVNNGGNLSVTKGGAGYWALSGQSTHSGNTSANGGTLGIAADSVGTVGAIISGPLGLGTFSMSNGSVVAVGTDRTVLNTVSIANNTTNGFTGDNSITFAANVTVTGGNNTNTYNNYLPTGKALTILGTFSHGDTNNKTQLFQGTGATVFSGPITNTNTGNLGLTLTGTTGSAASITLGNSGNAYRGTTTITTGRLILANNEVIPDGATFGNVTLNPGAGQTSTLDTGGFSETINGLTATSAGTTIIDNTTANPSSLTFGGNDSAVTFGAAAGTFQINNSGGGALSISKTGTGAATITSTAVLNYSGATSVSGGTFTINPALPNTSALNASGGTLNILGALGTALPVTATGGTITVSGAANGFTSVSATNNSTISLGGALSNPGLLTALTVDAGSTVSFVNGSGTPFANLSTLSLGAGTGAANLRLELGTSSDLFTSSTAATIQNSVLFRISEGEGFGAGNYNLLSAPSGLTGTYGLAAAPLGFNYGFTNTDSLVQLNVSVGAGLDIYWRGGVNNSWAGLNVSDTNFTTDLAGTINANGTPSSATSVFFSSTAATGPTIATTLDGNFSVKDLNFTADPTGVTSVSIAPGSLASNTLRIVTTSPTDGIDVGNNAGAVTISAPVSAVTAQTWNVDGTGTSSLTLSGALTGSNAIQKTGAGQLTLNGAAIAGSFTGGFSLAAGTTSFRSTGSGQVIPVGGGSGANLSVTGNTTIDVRGEVVASDGNAIVFGNLDLGAQTLTITGDTTPNTFAAVSATDLSNYSAIVSGTTNISGNATFTMGTSAQASAPLTLAGVVTSSGNIITVNGPATPALVSSLRLTNTSNNITGQFTIGSGGALETAVVVGGISNGDNSLGDADVFLDGGRLVIGTKIGAPITGTDGFNSTYYAGAIGSHVAQNLLGASIGSAVTGVINAPTASNVPGAGMTQPSGVPATNVSALFNGILTVTNPGYYTFNLSSDDGSALYVNGNLLINNDGGHGTPGTVPFGSIYLDAGQHTLTSRYFQGTGGGAIVLNYRGADTGNVNQLVGLTAGTVTAAALPTTTFSNPITLGGSTASTVEFASSAIIPGLTVAGGTGSTLRTYSQASGSLAINGPTTLGANFSIDSNGNNVSDVAFNGDISGGFSVTKIGTGRASFNVANSFSGGLNLNAGTAFLGHVGGAGPGTITFNGGGLAAAVDLSASGTGPVTNTVVLAGNGIVSGTMPLTLSGSVTNSAGDRTLTNSMVGADLRLAGPVYLSEASGTGRTLSFAGTGNTLIDGVISNFNGAGTASAIRKAGTGTVTLNAANTYTQQTRIDEGVLKFGVDQNMSASTNELFFGSTNAITTAGTLDLTSANGTFAGNFLAQTNTATANVLNIGPAQSLNIGGNFTVGSAANAVTTTALSTTGGGTLNHVTSTASAVFAVGGTTANAAQGNRAIADFSGLGTLNVNLSGATTTIRINPVNPNNVAGRFSTMIGATNTSLTATTLAIGNSAQNNSATQINEFKMGSGTTTINVDALNIGTGSRDNGSLTFNGPTGTLTIRNKAGTGRTAIGIANAGNATGVLGGGNTFDVRGHDVDLLVSTLTIGTASRGAVLQSTFSFDTGILDVDTITASIRGNTATGAVFNTQSTINLGGGTVNINAGVAQLGQIVAGANANTLSTGTINITGGTVAIGATGGTSVRMGGNAIATGLASGFLNITGGTTTLAGDIVHGSPASATSSATLTVDGGTLNVGGNDIGTLANAVTVVAESGTISNIGTINGTGGLTKTTADVLALAGTNTFTGDLNVNEGTVLVQGSISASVNVASGATLGGLGSITPGVTGSVSLLSGAILAPGASIGTLTVDGATSTAVPLVSFATGSTMLFELGATFTSDKFSITSGVAGDVAFNDNVINFSTLGSIDNGTYTLFTSDVANAYSGLTVDSGLITDGLFIGTGLEAYPGTALAVSGNDIVLTVVPEPGTALALLGGVATLLGLQRRRRRA